MPKITIMASNIRQLAILIDLSGTLHIGNTATPGSVEALKRLRSFPGVKLKFVTNTTKESGRYLHDRLKSIGFQIEKDEIFTSLTAARRLVESKSLRPMLLLEDVALEDFEGLPYLLPGANPTNGQSPNAVVIGLAPSRFDYQSINESFQRILQDKAQLIAVHKARYYKSDDGQLSLGPGPFAAALEYATECESTVVGKPEGRFFMDALGTLNGHLELENCVMIGDDARDDVGGAQGAGMKGILVKTGKYMDGDEKKIQPAPWAVVANFAEAVEKIERDLLKK